MWVGLLPCGGTTVERFVFIMKIKSHFVLLGQYMFIYYLYIMRKITITFEVENMKPGALHEAICLAIHEGDTTELDKLSEDVLDIQLHQ